MKQQKAVLVPKGISKDFAVTVFPKELAFDIKNMRFTSTGESEFMSLTNEKSNSKAIIYDIDSSIPNIMVDNLGTIIGIQKLDDYIILFRIESGDSVISKLTLESDNLYLKTLYRGKLNFSKDHPIESIGIIESETIHKVYWTDNYNSPRVINTSEEGINKIIDSDTQFDFVTTIPNTGMRVDIEKSFSGGIFKGGVVQYTIAYFTKYGQQSNFVYYSPLQYTSNLDRGVSAESTVSNTFKLIISNYATNFEYMRVYRIMRTSIDTVPSVERLPDIKISKDGIPITLYDTGKDGVSVDPTEIFFIGGKDFLADTLSHKDNTLFLGNITVKTTPINKEDKDDITNRSKENNKFILEEVNNVTEDTPDNINTLYYYNNTLKRPSNEITFFQKGETYRFGVQFLTKKGGWSDIVYLDDVLNDKRVEPSKYIDEIQKRPMFETAIPITNIKSKHPDFIAARLLCVYPTSLNREVLCQGIVIPTLYNLSDRLDNSPFAQASWFARPDYMLDDFNSMTSGTINTGESRSNMHNRRQFLKGFPLEYRMFNENRIKLLPDASEYNSEVQYSNTNNAERLKYVTTNMSLSDRVQHIKDTINYNNFGIDRSVVTMHSPELDSNFTDEFLNSSSEDIRFRIIGHVPYKGTFSDVSVEINSTFDPLTSYLMDYTIRNKSTDKNTLTGDSYNSFPQWLDGVSISSTSNGIEKIKPKTDNDDKNKEKYSFLGAFPVYPWQRAGSMNNQGKRTGDVQIGEEEGGIVATRHSVLKTKTISNFRTTLPPRFLNECFELFDITNVEFFNSNETVLKKLNTGWNSNKVINYYGNIDRALTVTRENDFTLYIGSGKLLQVIYDINDSESISDFRGNINEVTFIKGTDDAYITSNNNDGYYLPVDIVGGALGAKLGDTGNNYVPQDTETFSMDALPIQYKSSSHAVFGFKQTGNDYNLLPRFSKMALNRKIKLNVTVTKDIIGEGTHIQIIKGISNIVNSEFTKLPEGFLVGSLTEGGNTGTAKLHINLQGSSVAISNVQFYVSNSRAGLYNGGILVYPSMYINNKLFMRGMENNMVEGESLDPIFGFNKTYVVEEEDCNSLDLDLGYVENNNEYWQNIITKLVVNIKDTLTDEYFPMEIIFKKISNYYPEYDVTDNVMSKIIDTAPRYTTSTEESLISLRNITDDEHNVGTKIYNNIIWEESGQSDNFLQYIIPTKIDSIENTTTNENSNGIPLYDSCYVLGEFYRDVPNKFGGTSEEELSLNTWTPCSDIIYFDSAKDGLLTIRSNQGDTYFQRYDNLKTYPFSENSINNIVDIVSFCCETRINIDGRYDRQRDMESHLHIRPNNFNMFNPVYSQKNNIFNQPYLESNNFITNNFPNQITWSKEKTLGEEIDSWTSISLASTLDLDGDKGSLRKLLKHNNSIYAIQDAGTSVINFNPRVQINTSDGVPIEISNSGKVDGKVYISEEYGTNNKWSIVKNSTGFYFVDSNSQEILYCDGKEFTSITMKNGMSSWLKDKDTTSIWTPLNTKAIRALYDVKNKDIYFTTNYEALAYSELTSSFVSRYSYGNVGWLFNFNNDTYQVLSEEDNNTIWKLHGGDDYGYFFTEDRDTTPEEYSIEYIVNDNFVYDKMFDTVELLTNDAFIADRTGNMYPFNTLQTQNEYQESMAYSSSMKKKFRIWRWPIGRNSKNSIPSRDRIRNTWIKLKLTGTQSNKIQLYNTSVVYYV